MSADKVSYERPTLIEYGSMRELTLTRGSNGLADCGGGSGINCGNGGGNNRTSI